MDKIFYEILQKLADNKDKFEIGAKMQANVFNGVENPKVPLLLNCRLDENDKIPWFNSKEIHYDSEKMFLSQLRSTMSVIYGGCESVPSLRSNMGCGIFPTLFGLKQLIFEDKMPWIADHLDKETIAKMSVDDLKIGDEFKMALDHMDYIREKLKDTGCRVFPLDLQGAFDTAHLVYGDQIFYDLYDDPDFVHHLLELSNEAIFLGMDEVMKRIPTDDCIAHYNELVMPKTKGGIKISEDTSTLLSKDQLQEFVTPYTSKTLEHFGGGYIHYCGKNPHLFEEVMNMKNAYGLNFGNPDMHDMEVVIKRCVKENKVFYGSINRKNDETIEQYFEKYHKASLDSSGKSQLLLSFGCGKNERDEIADLWNKVTS